jgi:hypothetical protein
MLCYILIYLHYYILQYNKLKKLWCMYVTAFPTLFLENSLCQGLEKISRPTCSAHLSSYKTGLFFDIGSSFLFWAVAWYHELHGTWIKLNTPPVPSAPSSSSHLCCRATRGELAWQVESAYLVPCADKDALPNAYEGSRPYLGGPVERMQDDQWFSPHD